MGGRRQCLLRRLCGSSPCLALMHSCPLKPIAAPRRALLQLCLCSPGRRRRRRPFTPPQKTRGAGVEQFFSQLARPSPPDRTSYHPISSIPRAGNSTAIIMSAPTHVLFECATGCAIFQVTQVEEIAGKTTAVQEAALDIGNFGRMVKLLSFSPFRSAVDALQSCLDISEGQ